MPSALIKPAMWAFAPGLVDPKWAWFWAKDIRLAAPMWEGASRISDLSSYRNHGTLGGSADWVIGPRGRAVDFVDRTTHARIDHGSNASLDDLYPLTVIVLTRPGDLSTSDDDQRILTKSTEVTTGNGWSLCPANNAPFNGSIANSYVLVSGSGSLFDDEWAFTSPENSLVVGQWQVVAAEINADVGASVSGLVKIWVDGSENTTEVRGDTRISDADSNLYQGDKSGSTSAVEPYSGATALVYVIQGTLTDAQHKALAADPYGPIRKRRRAIVAGGGEPPPDPGDGSAYYYRNFILSRRAA